MKNFPFYFLYLLVQTLTLNAQQTQIVFLKDKSVNQSPVQPSERALQRRVKNNVKTDNYDLPIDAIYLSELSKHGRIVQTSRWLNAVRIETELSPELLVEKCPFY